MIILFLYEAMYDLDELARYNLHVHTNFSGCAAPEMTVPSIIDEAEKSGIETLAFTDHIMFADEIDEHIEQNNIIKELVEKTETKINVLYSGEFSAYAVGEYTLKGSDYKPDYRLYSTNHYHIKRWENPDEKSPDAYKEHAKKMLDILFDNHEADCIAHPLYGRFSARFLDAVYSTEVERIGQAWSDNEIGDMLIKGYNSGCAWELNVGAVLGDPKFFRRIFNIGREAGVVFNYGTDAHHLCQIDTHKNLDEVKRILL